MPIVERKMFVVTCPNCGEPIDFDGEGHGGHQVFDSPQQAENYMESHGYYDTKRVRGREKVTAICPCEGRKDNRDWATKKEKDRR